MGIGFAPGLDIAISTPAELLSRRVDQIILMNSIYLREVETTLATLGLHPEILTIDGPPG